MDKVEIKPSAFIFPTPLTIITAYDDQGKPQGFVNTWIMNTSTNPPTIAIITRRGRQTYNSIIKQQCFGVNLVNEELLEVADYFGQVSGSDEDKFRKCNLSIVTGKVEKVPLINDCPANFDCKLIQQIDIADTVMLIGEVKKSYLSKYILDENGCPSDQLLRSVMQGLTHYLGVIYDIVPVGFSKK